MIELELVLLAELVRGCAWRTDHVHEGRVGRGWRRVAGQRGEPQSCARARRRGGKEARLYEQLVVLPVDARRLKRSLLAGAGQVEDVVPHAKRNVAGAFVCLGGNLALGLGIQTRFQGATRSFAGQKLTFSSTNPRESPGSGSGST